MRAALWLMRRFDVPENLTGDLVEQRERGRSVVWFWRQTIDAVANTVGGAVRRDVRTAVVGASVSFAALLVWVEATWLLYTWAMVNWLAPIVRSLDAFGHPVLSHYPPLVQRLGWSWWNVYSIGMGLLWCLGAALIGRAAGNRRSGSAVIVAVAAQLPLVFWWGIPMWRNAMVYVGREAAHPMDVQLVALTALVWFGMPLATLLGGLSAPRVRRQDAVA
jgi:hypothetical protein